MLLTVEGQYKDGKVQLTEAPTGVAEARVIVTFLPPTSPARLKAVAPVTAVEPGMMHFGQFAGPHMSREEDFTAPLPTPFPATSRP